MCLVVKRIRNFSYTPRVGICLVVRRERRISLTRPVLVCTGSFGLVEFLFHAPFWNLTWVGMGKSLLHAPVYQSVSSFGLGRASLSRPCWKLSGRSVGSGGGGESLLHAPCSNFCLRRSSGGEFLLHAPCWNLFGRLVGGESLLHANAISIRLAQVCQSFRTGSSGRCEKSGNFYTPRAKNLSGHMSGTKVSLTHPVQASVSSLGEWGVSITCPVLESVSSRSGW